MKGVGNISTRLAVGNKGTFEKCGRSGEGHGMGSAGCEICRERADVKDECMWVEEIVGSH